MYSDLRTHARHAETLRSNTVNYVIAVAAALIAFISADGNIEPAEFPICTAVVLVGLLGFVYTASYTELFLRNDRRAKCFRARLDDLLFADEHTTIAGLLDASDLAHEATRTYRWSRGLTGSASWFWLLVPALVVIAGIALSLVALPTSLQLPDMFRWTVR